MAAQYFFERVNETERMNKSLEAIIHGSSVSSRETSNKFYSYGDGIADDGFYLGNLVTDYIDHIAINNLTSYVLSIPKKGLYAVGDKNSEELGIDGQSGVLALPSESVRYTSKAERIDDYMIIIDQNELNEAIEKKYNLPDFDSNMLALSLKCKQVEACFQFIESTLNMLRAFPSARQSELVKKNLKGISTYMLIDIIAESTNAKLNMDLNPQKYLVAKAEEIIEAECEKLFTIQEVADRVFTSPRNLQAAFKKHRNYSPIQFLKVRKLHKARRNILASKGQKCIIKQIALEVGIFDLNRFSMNYAKEFGELPSATVRNSNK